MSNAELEVRTVRLEDAVALAVLAGELGYPNTADEMRARLNLLHDRADHWVGVAARGSVPLGWVHVARRLVLESGECAEILGLIVSESARNTGIGRRLVAAAEHWSRSLGLASIAVRSNVLRVESHRFYPALGYARTKSQHVYAKALAAAPGSTGDGAP
jgi:GNAT superfamily N-acetyltransferase